MTTANFKYIKQSGDEAQGELRLEDYRTAKECGMTTTQYINAKYSDADVKNYGTAWEQGLQSVGIYTKSIPEHGVKVSSMNEVLNGTALERRMAGEGLTSGGGVVAPSLQGTTPATRIFFPEVVLNFLTEVLDDDYSLEQQIWSSMIGSEETIPTEMFTQPLINVTAPEAEDSAPISQNALPKTLISITTSQISKSIVTNSVGLQISEQATRNASIDLIGTIFARQMRGEELRLMWRDISNVVNGNIDAGETALASAAFTTYDPGAAAGTVTQTGWIKYLYDPTRTIAIDSIITDIDTYLAIQNRTGRPVIFDPNTVGSNLGNLGSYGLNSEPNLLNVSLGVPNVMVVPTATIGANNILGFDSRTALRRVTNASAAYSATEEMILQRSNFFRVDWGWLTYRLYDEAFRLTNIT